MKLRDDLNCEVLLEYGFRKKINHDDMPETKFWENYDPEKHTDDDLKKAQDKQKEYEKTHIVVEDDYDALYYLDGYLFYNCGLSRRGQVYYILFNIESRIFEMYSKNGDGSSGTIDMPNVLIDLIKNNIIKE